MASNDHSERYVYTSANGFDYDNPFLIILSINLFYCEYLYPQYLKNIITRNDFNHLYILNMNKESITNAFHIFQIIHEHSMSTKPTQGITVIRIELKILV